MLLSLVYKIQNSISIITRSWELTGSSSSTIQRSAQPSSCYTLSSAIIHRTINFWTFNTNESKSGSTNAFTEGVRSTRRITKPDEKGRGWVGFWSVHVPSCMWVFCKIDLEFFLILHCYTLPIIEFIAFFFLKPTYFHFYFFILSLQTWGICIMLGRTR